MNEHEQGPYPGGEFLLKKQPKLRRSLKVPKRVRPTALAPININLDNRVDELRPVLTTNLDADLLKVREFINKELASPLISLDSGPLEAKEILGAIFEEEPNLDVAMRAIQPLIGASIQLRSVRLLSDLFKLTQQETTMLYFILIAKVTNANPDEKLMSYLLRLSNMSGQEKAPPVPLLESRPAKRAPKRNRSGEHQVNERAGKEKATKKPVGVRQRRSVRSPE